MKTSLIALALVSAVVLISPVSALAATNAGVKPGNFWYSFDIAFEKINLFFTFNSESKAKKALEYANERLAEAEAVTEDAEAVKTAITNYESNIAFAAEKSKDVGDKEKAEALLTSIADNTSKHQEILADVLAKVPDEAKEAIIKAIEVSRKGQEEAMQKIAELKGEVEKLKKEVAELKAKDEEREKQLNRPESESTSKPMPASIKPIIPQTSESITTPKPTTPAKVIEPKTTEPVVQPPVNTTQTPEPTPPPTTQTQSSVAIQISSVNITPSLTSAQIEWQTNILTSSKIFLSGGNISSNVFSSESGLSTRHIVNATGLTSGTTYSYEIEAVADDQVMKKQGSFTTKPDDLVLSLQVDKTSVQLTDWNYVKVTAQFTKNGKLVPVDVSFSAPDDSKTYKVIQNWPECGNIPFLIQLAGTTGGTCSSDAKVNFEYRPKSLGTHKIIATASGVNKSIDIQATEYVVIPYFVADISFDKETVANDGIDSIKVNITTKDSSGKILSNKSVQVKTYKTETLTSDQNGIINTTITTTETGGQHSLVVSADNRSYSKNYQVINVRKKISFGVLSAADFGNISAPAINEGLIMLIFDKSFSEIQNLKLKKVTFKLEGLTPDWITNIKFTKSEADDRHDVLPPVIIPSTYSFTSDGMVSLIPSAPIEMFYNDRLTIVADIKNNSDQKSGTGVKILEYAVIIYQDSFEFSGVVSGRTGIITPELTNYNYGPNALLTLPSRKTNWLVTNYCMSGNTIVTCFDQ